MKQPKSACTLTCKCLTKDVQCRWSVYGELNINCSCTCTYMYMYWLLKLESAFPIGYMINTLSRLIFKKGTFGESETQLSYFGNTVRYTCDLPVTTWVWHLHSSNMKWKMRKWKPINTLSERKISKHPAHKYFSWNKLNCYIFLIQIYICTTWTSYMSILCNIHLLIN